MWRCYGVGRVTDMSCTVSKNVEVLRVERVTDMSCSVSRNVEVLRCRACD